MNSPFRALAICAVAVVAGLACPAVWAQATHLQASPPANQPDGPVSTPPPDQWQELRLVASQSAYPVAGAPPGQPADSPQADSPADSPADSRSDSAADSAADSAGDFAAHPDVRRLLGDVKDYYTAPLRWDGEQWAFFGGTLGAVALAHHYDSNMRAHFVQGPGIGGSTSDLQDALPAAALVAGTYIYASQWQDRSGLTATYAMLEAAGLSTVTAYALKYAVRRSGPSETTDPNKWFGSGTSFPSEHAAAAFAIGTVFAESGSGGYRWVTRALGYGIASFTAYERLKHNAHWLSDVVAGAALGVSTGAFVVDRTYGGAGSAAAFSVVPVDGGLMLAYHKALP